MLSSVLNSDRAVEVNIEIMRAFVRLREMMASHKDLDRKIIALEKNTISTAGCTREMNRKTCSKRSP